MSNTIRGKFRCDAVTYHGDPDSLDSPRTYEMRAVYDNLTPENARFAKATPWGELKMRIDNPAARLNVAEEYYLDFTRCADAHALEESAVAAAEPAEVAHPDAGEPVIVSGNYTSGG